MPEFRLWFRCDHRSKGHRCKRTFSSSNSTLDTAEANAHVSFGWYIKIRSRPVKPGVPEREDYVERFCPLHADRHGAPPRPSSM